MINFKNKKDAKLFSKLNPIVMLIFLDMLIYAKNKHNIDLVVTDTLSNDFLSKALKRKSRSHIEGRAIDIRTRNLDVFIMRDIMDFINNKEEYKKYHYLSKSGEYRLAYYHNNGNGEHLHLAIHSKFANNSK